MGEAVKKYLRGLFFIFFICQTLYAEDDVDKLKRRVSIICPNTPGWCSEEKGLNFLDLVLEVKPKVCVEIGVFGGASLIPVAAGLKFLNAGIVIGIDPWNSGEAIKHLDTLEEKEHIDWWSKINLSEIYYSFLERLLLYDLEKHCVILKKTSEQAAFEMGEIDILHIDGHRSETQTVQDVRLYLPKVVSGGHIWLGDALNYNKQKAIDFLLTQCDVIKVIENGNCILFKKR